MGMKKPRTLAGLSQDSGLVSELPRVRGGVVIPTRPRARDLEVGITSTILERVLDILP